MRSNYEAFKAGTGLRDVQIYFIVPKSENIGTWFGFPEEYIRWCTALFTKSVFVGSKESCERNLPNYPDCKIVEPQFKLWF